jgi:hypothetical protein
MKTKGFIRKTFLFSTDEKINILFVFLFSAYNIGQKENIIYIKKSLFY